MLVVPNGGREKNNCYCYFFFFLCKGISFFFFFFFCFCFCSSSSLFFHAFVFSVFLLFPSLSYLCLSLLFCFSFFFCLVFCSLFSSFSFIPPVCSLIPWYGIYKGGKGDRELLYPCPVIV